jgi:hypothetical protein
LSHGLRQQQASGFLIPCAQNRSSFNAVGFCLYCGMDFRQMSMELQIRCKGGHGFGEGNFRALFESIEPEQLRRDVIRHDGASTKT